MSLYIGSQSLRRSEADGCRCAKLRLGEREADLFVALG